MVELKTHNITVAKFVQSEFDASEQLFRRKIIGADGIGYEFVRPVSVDRENMLMESAIAHDLRHWFNHEQEDGSCVVALTPRHNSNRPTEWRPAIMISRPTRHYWLSERRQIHSRVKDSEGNTYNVFTPLSFLRNLLTVFDNREASLRAEAYNYVPHSYIPDSVSLRNNPGSL